MSDAEFDLVCIGSGPAGQSAAIQAAKLGKRVAIIERQRSVGGVCVDTGTLPWKTSTEQCRCVDTGTIPSKTFREAVGGVYSRPGLDGQDASDRERGRPSMTQLVGHVAR